MLLQQIGRTTKLLEASRLFSHALSLYAPVVPRRALAFPSFPIKIVFAILEAKYLHT